MRAMSHPRAKVRSLTSSIVFCRYCDLHEARLGSNIAAESLLTGAFHDKSKVLDQTSRRGCFNRRSGQFRVQVEQATDFTSG
jgi:hypothetical protein